MRTYKVSYLVGTRVIYSCKLKARNLAECKALAKRQSIPTTEQWDSIFVKVIKNKGDK